MRDPERIKRILNIIQRIWLTYPDLRLSQLLINAVGTQELSYHVEDDVLEEFLLEMEKRFQ